MKSPFAKFQSPDEPLESSLRKAAPINEPPATLHSSIMRAVRAARREEISKPSRTPIFQFLAEVRWLPITGVASLLLLGIWIAFHNQSERTTSAAHSLPEISAAFSASQEIADTLPSVAIGPLSDELDKVNQDLNRTAEFLLAALP